jgi:Ribosomal protein L7/L12 C-terminal domain
MKMKLDKIKFAQLIAYISNIVSRQSIDSTDISMLDDLIDIEVPTQVANIVKCSDVDQLMALMNEGTRKIEAIKAYRTLTGAGLKESKDAVEKYWNNKGHYVPDEKKPASEATLGDILHSAGRNKAGNDISGI